MKKFKTIDCWISIVLIISCMAACITKAFNGDIFETLVTSYFILGTWQVISMITHAYTGTFVNRTGARYIYHWISLVSLVTIPFGSVWVLYFAAPFMAVYYTWLCYHEVHVKMQRPLALLK